MAPRPVTCPRCGNRSGVRIVYGFPDSELFKQAESGLVALGGCLILDGNATRRCLREDCGHEW